MYHIHNLSLDGLATTLDIPYSGTYENCLKWLRKNKISGLRYNICIHNFRFEVKK